MGIAVINRPFSGNIRDFPMLVNTEMTKELKKELSGTQMFDPENLGQIAVFGPIDNIQETSVFVTEILDEIPEPARTEAYTKLSLILTSLVRKYFGKKEIRIDYANLKFATSA